MAMANKTKSAPFALPLAGLLTAVCLLATPARADSWWDKLFGSVTPIDKPVAATIDYSERPKLKVPPQKLLPPPAPAPERRVNNVDSSEALTKPQPELLEKVTGADGKVSGMKEGDEGKAKFLNFF